MIFFNLTHKHKNSFAHFYGILNVEKKKRKGSRDLFPKKECRAENVELTL